MGKTAIALGLFDGIHLGHRRVLETTLEQQEAGLRPCAYTFPAETAVHKNGAAYIYPTELKKWLLYDTCAMEQVFCPDFADVSSMTGEAFARDVLAGQLDAGCVVCGRDFRFGKNAVCGEKELRELGERYGFAVEVTEDVRMEGETVSSGRIRTFLQNGELRRANRLLGEPYLIRDMVHHGASLGRTLGFPTINQIFRQGQLVPRCGVYASFVRVPAGGWYHGLTNIGVKPTVQYGGSPLAETYIDGFSGDLYGQTVQVILQEFIRPEQRFASVEQLLQQMQADLEQCRRLW